MQYNQYRVTFLSLQSVLPRDNLRSENPIEVGNSMDVTPKFRLTMLKLNFLHTNAEDSLFILVN